MHLGINSIEDNVPKARTVTEGHVPRPLYATIRVVCPNIESMTI